MKDGMGAEYEQALENANSKLDQYADAPDRRRLPDEGRLQRQPGIDRVY